MAHRDRIRLAAYWPNPDAVSFTESFHTLTFPREWREAILELYRLGRPQPDQTRSVPIRRLNGVLQAVAPDLVSVGRGAAVDDDTPWLYARAPLEPGLLAAIITLWVRNLKPAPEHHATVLEVLDRLRPDNLRWEPAEPIDLLRQTETTGGTAEPADYVYQLLPDVLARRIIAQGKYVEDGAAPLEFVAAPRDRGVELVSWPPEQTPDDDGRSWYFSYLVTLTVQTVPFDSRPRVHVKTGVRRWLSTQEVWIPWRRSVSVFLRAEMPWLAGAPASTRFAVSSLRWDADSKQVRWAPGGLEGILEHLRFKQDFPNPEQLKVEPGRWLHRRDGVTVAVVYSSMMGSHEVGAGIMPRQRAPLTEWVGNALEPDLVRVPDLEPSRYSTSPRNRPAKPHGKGKTKSDRKASLEAQKQHLKGQETAGRRRDLAALLNGRPLIVDLLKQTGTMEEAAVAALAEVLGLKGPGGSGTLRTWDTEEKLEVRLHIRELGALGDPLRLDTHTGSVAEKVTAAISERRDEVRAYVAEKSLHPAGLDRPRLALVELDGPRSFRKRDPHGRSDPKFALRLGLADVGLVSQFMRTATTSRTKRLDQRVRASWLDGLRQLGLRIIPEHSLNDDPDGRIVIPSDVQYVAVWMAKRRADGPTKEPAIVPLAVRIGDDAAGITGWDDETKDWVPYPTHLLRLTRHAILPPETEEPQAEHPWRQEQRRERLARFVRGRLLAGLRMSDRPTLLLVHAQNIRGSLPWVQNSNVEKDRIQFLNRPVQRLAVSGRQLRLVRIRDGDETAQWWAPADEKDEHGFSSGLWVDSSATDPDLRVFASTAEKPDTAKDAAVTASKSAPRVNQKGEEVVDTDKPAWNPDMVEIAVLGCRSRQALDEDGRLRPGTAPDDPEAWAALTHQLRQAPDYRGTLKLPLPLHLAMLATEYVLPVKSDASRPGMVVDEFEETESDDDTDDSNPGLAVDSRA